MVPGKVELSEAVKQLYQFIRRTSWLRMAEPSLRIVGWQDHVFNQLSQSLFNTLKPLLRLSSLGMTQLSPLLGNLNQVAALIKANRFLALEPTHARVTPCSLT